LGIGVKRNFNELIENFPMEMNGLFIRVKLIILPLGLYDTLIGMDMLKKHKVNLDFYNNRFECIDNEGNPILVKGTPRTISIWYISTLKLKRSFRKLFHFMYFMYWIERKTKIQILKTTEYSNNLRIPF
jgi:hypothetical protein